MCGISGIHLNGNAAIPSESQLLKLVQSLAHRGPDGSSYLIIDHTALVHTRLAIIDLQGGTQPISIENLNIIVNGEIYNYKELANELSPIHLKTSSDSELPLHLWDRINKEYPQKLRGMYAIALYDEGKKQLVLSRDPFGIKPLYYAQLKEGLVFASEPQALIKSGLIQAKINPSARDELLQIQFSMGSKTIFEGIQRVLPGETIFCQQDEIKETKITPALSLRKTQKITEEQTLRNLEDVLTESISLHLRSDVPCGVFLSSGIDSSAIITLMARLSSQPVLSFTAGFDVPGSADERAKASKIAATVGAKHESIEINENMVWQHLPEIVAAMDDPCADYAIIPTWFLAKRAAQDVKVVLSGEGGDELFGGYGRYRQFMRHPLLGGRAMRSKGNFNRVNVLRENSKDWRKPITTAETQLAADYPSRLMQAQAMDCMDWLPNDLLIKLDRCLMAHGVEGRTPFLDPAVADFAFNLPDNFKIRDGFGKWILRRWLQNNLVEYQAFDPKQGFTVPIGAWINKQHKKLATLVAQQEGILEIADSKNVMELYSNIDSKKGAGIAAWSLLFYALWHQHHILGHASDGNVFDVLSAR